MCEEKNINKISFVVFIIMQNYIMFNYFLLPYTIKEHYQTGYISFIIMLMISLVLVLLLPKNIGTINYFDIIKKSVFLKYILVISKFIIGCLTIYMSVRTLSAAIYPTVPMLFFIGTLVIGSVYISTFQANHIINSSTIFFLFGIFLIIVGLFLNSSINDYDMLLPFIYDSTLNDIIIVYFTLDGISLIFLNNGTTQKLKKKDITIGVGVLFIICILETVNVITLCGTDYLINNEFLGFFSLYIQDTLTYVGNLSFIYILIIPMVCLFKTGLSIKYVRELLTIKRNKIFNIIISLLLGVVVLIMTLDVELTNQFFGYILLIPSLGLSFIYIFILLNRSDKVEITI